MLGPAVSLPFLLRPEAETEPAFERIRRIDLGAGDTGTMGSPHVHMSGSVIL